MNTTRGNTAVSEIIGTILLLLIAVTFFSVVYIAFFTIQVSPQTPMTSLVGTIENNELIMEHRGGDFLSLDTTLLIELPNGARKTIDINNYLNPTAKSDNKWGIGEKLEYPLNTEPGFQRFDDLQVTIVDKDSNSVVLLGTVQEARVADIDVEMSISPNNHPPVGSTITITITITNNGPSDTANLQIRYILPSSLFYISNTTTHGRYNHYTGLWNTENVPIPENGQVTLSIAALVQPIGNRPNTQFVLLMDGSGSISSDAWTLAKQGIATSVGDQTIFPRDGSVELTIIQFGKGPNGVCAGVEVGPVVVTSSNYASIVNQINAIPQGRGWTPMATGIYLITSTLPTSNSFGGFNFNNDQIILLVTDGNANVLGNPGETCGTDPGSDSGHYTRGKNAAATARNNLIDQLQMRTTSDQFDVISVDDDVDQDFLKNRIVWPEPCYDLTPLPGDPIERPPAGRGWYIHVEDWQEFYEAIGTLFQIIFGKIDTHAELVGSVYMDPNDVNNIASFSIYPS